MFLFHWLLVLVSASSAQSREEFCQPQEKKIDCAITYRQADQDILDIQEVSFTLKKKSDFLCDNGEIGQDYVGHFKIPNTNYSAEISSDFYMMHLSIFENGEEKILGSSTPPVLIDGSGTFSAAQYRINKTDYLMIYCYSGQ